MYPGMIAAKAIVGHQLRRTLGVICTLLVLAGIGWTIYVTVVRPHTKPNPTTTQIAEGIINTYNYGDEEQFFFGVKLWGVKLGITKNKRIIKVEPKTTKKMELK